MRYHHPTWKWGMKVSVALLCAAAGLICGITSGIFWIRAARLLLKEADVWPRPVPPPRTSSQKPISLGAIGRYVGESGNLNWKAAAWSIAAVIFSSLSSLLGLVGL
jgi:hypothetical protein